MLNGHGNNLYDYNGNITADFSSNIPYRNASAHIAEHLGNCLRLIGNYPDPNAHRLTAQLVAHHAVSAGSVLVTNGSAEAFYLLAHLFARKRSTIAFPAFAEYEDACTLHRHRLSFLPLSELHAQSRFAADTVWFAAPNNPDGRIVPRETIESVCLQHPRTHFIIDNAYGELCPQCPQIIPLHQRHKNLISVHSLTKTFGIPGLRLGYIIAHEQLIEKLQHFRTPWTVNALALAAGSFVMENYARLLPDSDALCRESLEFQRQLVALPQLEITPSPCNYFLARLKSGTAARLKAHLIENHGLLIRNADNFRGLSPAHIRLSVQSEENNSLLINAIKDYLVR